MLQVQRVDLVAEDTVSFGTHLPLPTFRSQKVASYLFVLFSQALFFVDLDFYLVGQISFLESY